MRERLALEPLDFPTSGFPRMPTVLGGAMAATSHPQATRVAVAMLERGGNAVDAAVAAAAVLTVAEPSNNGLGGDGFALVWHAGALYGINGSGRAPMAVGDVSFERHGPRSVTVPGAVAMWADLLARFGRFGLDACLQPAIDLAQRGLPATRREADLWHQAFTEGRAPRPAPRAGEHYTLPALATTLRTIAANGPAALYQGPIGEAIAAASWLSIDDLAQHRSEWVDPLRVRYKGVDVCELPPNCQGVAALLALALFDGLEAESPAGRLHLQIEAAKLALADAYRFVGDAPLPAWFLQADHLVRRRGLISAERAHDAEPTPGPETSTTYLCCVDEDRNAVSLIQSLYERFGSGVVAGDTGVVLQNRAWGFTCEAGHPNVFAPGKRPFHTIIPGMLVRDGQLMGPFGVMGGSMQAQAHLQLVTRVLDQGADPQVALDAARFRVEPGRGVLMEPGLAVYAAELERRGHEVIVGQSPHPFGVGQMIMCDDDALVGGSDGRGDGYAGGY
jgi:gamma-glutamyltranspeptidase/glutathione hydrolase